MFTLISDVCEELQSGARAQMETVYCQVKSVIFLNDVNTNNPAE